MADTAIQAPTEASAETQEILKELQKEGHDINGMPPAADDANKAAEEAKAKEEADAKAKADADAKAAEEAAEAKAKAEAGDGDGGDGKKEDKKTNRTVQNVPVGKYNDERHKRQDAEKRAETAEQSARDLQTKLDAVLAGGSGSKSQVDALKAAAAKVAEKHGADPDFVNDFAEAIADAMKTGAALPAEMQEALDNFKKSTAEADAAKQEAEQEKFFNQDFDEMLKGFDAESPEYKHLASRKEDLKQLAFTEGNEHTSLRRIALEFIHDNPPERPGRKTFETPVRAGGGDKSQVIDYANLTEEEFANLPSDKVDEYLEWQKKNKK